MALSKTSPSFDLQQAHRWFAVELNNLAWDWIEADSPSPADGARMIHAAHAACFHWLEAGNLLNHLRAECLLAMVYAKAGLGEAAARHADRCLALSDEAGDKQTAFDRASAHGCASVAYSKAGRSEAAKEHALAMTAAHALDESDKAVFVKLFATP